MDAPIVETTAGKVRGRRDSGICAFKGIPFATAARFQAPARPTPWSGVRDASAYGPTCPQLAPPTAASPIRPSSVAADAPPMDEACLVVNVWTPALDGRRPVMLWLHGGGYHMGSASVPQTDGTRLARRDVVVVSANHRLGALGYAYLGQAAGDAYASSGNNGLLDIVAALQWIRDNIANFGGDPGNVTVFGLSGGGAKATSLLALPAARGLFHKAISSSGADVFHLDPDAATARTAALLDALELPRNAPLKLLDVPVEQLVAATRAVPGSPIPGAAFGPVVDGANLPQHPIDAIAAGSAAGIPLIIGTAREETTALLPLGEDGALDASSRWPRVRASLGADADAMIAAYRAAYPAHSDTELWIAFATDRVRVPAIRIAEAQVAGGAGAPVYMYRFAFPSPVAGGVYRAHHGGDVSFYFDNTTTHAPIAESPEAAALGASLADSWAAFARTGDPTVASLPRWPCYDLETRATILLDARSTIEHDPDPVGRRTWRTGQLVGAGLLSRTP
jgi:para-nitrobenzyl esterase